MALTLEDLKKQKKSPIKERITLPTTSEDHERYYGLLDRLEKTTGANLHNLARERIRALMEEIESVLEDQAS